MFNKDVISFDDEDESSHHALNDEHIEKILNDKEITSKEANRKWVIDARAELKREKLEKKMFGLNTIFQSQCPL